MDENVGIWNLILGPLSDLSPYPGSNITTTFGLRNSDISMAIILHGSVRLLRRSAQRHQQLFSPTRRQKTTAADKPSERSSTVIKREGSTTTMPAEISPRPLWERLGPLSEAFVLYARAQRRRPWTTQLGTSLVVYLCGDLTAQYIDGEEYNIFRTLRHLTIGGIISIPAYTWCDISIKVALEIYKADNYYAGLSI